MQKYVITLDNPKYAKRLERFTEEAAKKGIFGCRPFNGVIGNNFGFTTTFSYEVDNPTENYHIGPDTIGGILSHWMLWTILDSINEQHGLSEPVMILEDDAEFHEDAMAKIASVMTRLPPDWDILFPGSCCTTGRIKAQLYNDLYECWPLCSQCYIVQPKALKTIVATNRMAWGPIDLQMYFKSFPVMKIYAIIPRVVDQFDTDFPA